LAHLRRLASFIRILAVNEQVITQALHSAFTDFEEAIQYYTAKRQHIKFLVTQNTQDYTTVDPHIMQVVTAEAYLQLWDASSGLPGSKQTKRGKRP
jgi:hypothetical protein